MLQIEHPYFLWFLALYPLFVALFVMRQKWKKKVMERFGSLGMLLKLSPDRSPFRVRWKFFMMTAGYFAICVGLSNPRIGSKYEEIKREGIDLVIALDVSNSMLAEDIKPNRLSRAKQAISKLIDKLQDDRIGIVVFAGDAMLQLPFTNDYAAAKLFLSSVGPESVQYQGTSIGSAIALSVRSLPKGGLRNKAIIVISDGEDHEENALEEAKTAKSAGIVVHTIGIGLEGGSPIPVYEQGRNTGFRKDSEGGIVISRMNPEVLGQIAIAGGGKFVQSSQSDIGLETLFTQISSMDKAELGTKTFTDFEDRFQWFIAAFICLVFFEFLITERKGKIAQKYTIFGKQDD